MEELDGIDPGLIAEIRARLADPKEMEGVDPGLVSEIKTRMGVYEQPKNDETAWKAQNPIAGGIEAISEEATKYIGEPFNKSMQQIGKAMGEPPKPVGWLYKRAQQVRDAGLKLEDQGDKMLTSGNYGKMIPNIVRAMGIMLENSPIPASNEEVAGMSVLGGANKAKTPIAEGAKSVAKKLPGVEPFVTNEKLPAIIAKEAKQAISERNDAAQVVKNLEQGVTKLQENASPKLDSVAYGNAVKNLLDGRTALAATPLKKASKFIQKTTEDFGKGSVEPLAPEILKIREDLLSIVKTNKDSPVVSTLEKYLGKKAKDVEGNTYVKYPETSVGGLLKDRGRLGKEYVRLLEAGEKGTPQTTAVLRLQQIIDGAIDERLKSAPELNNLIKTTRKGWSQHYDLYWSDEAVALRKADPSKVVSTVLKSPETIDAARMLMPEALEEAIRTKKSQLVRDMPQGAGAIKYVDNELSPGTSSKPAGYYQRLLKPEDVVELRQMASLQERLPVAKQRMQELVDVLESSPIKGRRLSDTIKTTSRRKGELNKGLGVLDSLRSLQSTRAAVPAEALVLAHYVNWISPKAAQVIVGVGVTPAALAWAYYSVPKAKRAAIGAAFKRVSEQGPKAPAADLQLLRRIEAGQITDDEGQPKEIKNPLGSLGNYQRFSVNTPAGQDRGFSNLPLNAPLQDVADDEAAYEE